MNKELGKIKRADLREIFKDEARDFTPWLQKNVGQLSDVLGIEIGEIRREEGVGNFNCDLIAIETNSEDKIVIENQLESTNHDHLGKLITYASGVEAKYVVWVSKRIREEHQKALEWLNENSGTTTVYFGIEVSVITIDDSKPAVSLKVVVEPNTWSKELKQKTEKIDERHQKYLQFFTRLVSEYEKVKPEWGHLTSQPSSWLQFGAGKAGFSFVWAFRGSNRFDIELYIDTKDKEETKNYFAELSKFKKEIDSQIPDLSWEELPERRGSRIALYFQMPTSARNMNDDQMNQLIIWAIEKMDLFKKIFPKYIQKFGN
ncbi:MAG: DUF4268 domain-containing protein [Patescibacteria group bacterium]|nr:DUF4268 domain-containing protein [Patescibacteria group bacterium]